MTEFTLHHIAVTVSDLDRSAAFYKHFGFEPVLSWAAADGSVTIVHLQHPAGHLLELVTYRNLVLPTKPPAVGNDLDVVAVKHLAVRVDDIAAAHAEIVALDLGEVTDLQHGRTRMDLFFVRDPDGLWVEVVEDNRQLDPAAPEHIVEAPRLLEGE
jgi:glyoxylase I family protein